VFPFLGCFPDIWPTHWRPMADTIPEIKLHISTDTIISNFIH
jgi:hypothetical protein